MSVAASGANASSSCESLLGELEGAASWLKKLAAADWDKESADGAKAAVLLLEQVARHTCAIKAGVLARVESSGAWEGEGQRTMGSWITTRTRSSRKAAFQDLELAKTLHEGLPETKKALAEGLIGEEHAQVIARECTKSDSLKKKLADPQRGETFLVQKAQEVDATGFVRLAKGWAVETDPKGADRAWRKDAANEDLTVTPMGEGYRVN